MPAPAESLCRPGYCFLYIMPLLYIFPEQEQEPGKENDCHQERNRPYGYPVVLSLFGIEVHHVSGNQRAEVFAHPVRGKSDETLRGVTQRGGSLFIHEQLPGNEKEGKAEPVKRQHRVDESVLAGADSQREKPVHQDPCRDGGDDTALVP